MIVTGKENENSLFSVYDPLGVKLLTRLRLQFRHLNEHKLRHGFSDTVSPMCGSNAEIENTEHLFLSCHFCYTQRFELFDNINKVNLSFTQSGTKELVNILFYGYSPNKSNTLNQDVIRFLINFLKNLVA